MPEYVIDFSEFSKVLDELLSKTSPNTKSESEPKSDMISKYKKLYEASVRIEELRNRRVETVQYIDAYKTKLKSIDDQIDELNKLFSN